MNTKNLMVFFLATVFIALSISAVSAAATDVTENARVTVDGLIVGSYDGITTTFAQNMSSNPGTPGVTAGDTINVKINFVALNNATVTFKAELEGQKDDTRVVSEPFVVIKGSSYSKIVALKVPSELKDELSDGLTLSVKLDGSDQKTGNDYKTAMNDMPLLAQRPSYNADIKSIGTSQFLTAGEKAPVDIVLKNVGYNDLEDLYVTVKIAELGIERSAYFGDLANIESCTGDCNKEDTVSGRIYLDIPYDVKAGSYDLSVVVKNTDVSLKQTKHVVIDNDFSQRVIVTSDKKTAAAGEDAKYELLLVNPTNKLVVYRVATESSEKLTSSASETLLAIPAGSSKTVDVLASANEAGEYNFDVSVFSNDASIGKATLNLSVEGKKSTIADPIVILTIVLAVVFIVLLVVLIVLLGKKPKSEDFGESYY